MNPLLQPPAQGEPVDELWRRVVALTERVNAISNPEVRVLNPAPTTGKLIISGGQSVLVLQ